MRMAIFSLINKKNSFMKKFLIYTAKITILLVAVVLITLPLLGEERYVNLAFYLSIGCLVFLIGLDKK